MNPASITITAFCVLAALEAASGAEAPSVLLTGIVDVEGQRQAIFEITSGKGRVMKPILSEGERTEAVELRRIDSKLGRVELLVDGNESFQVLDGGRESAWVPGLHFKGADLRQVLEIYQQLCGRTVLYPDALPGLKFDLKTGALSRAAAIDELEAQFRSKGLEIQPRGTKFVFVVQARQVDRLTSIPDAAFASRGDDGKVLPAGLIKFQSADVRQVSEIYQELTGRTVLQPADLHGKISVRTQTPLTRDEAIWVIESILALAHLDGGLLIQPRGSKFVFVVPASHAARLAAIPDVAAQPVKEEDGVMPAGMLRFQEADSSSALEVYQELSGKTVLRSQELSGRVTVRSQTPLTRAEAQWLLQAALGVADVAMISEGERFVLALKGVENPNVPPLPRNAHIPVANSSVRSPLEFKDAAVTNILALYAGLLGRTPMPLDTTPAIRMSLLSRGGLTPSETLFALDALAALRHCRFDLVGDNQVRIVPAALPRPNDALTPNPK